MEILIRKGCKSDLKAVHTLIVELAVYEKAGDQVATTPDSLMTDFSDGLYDFFVAEDDNHNILGFALFYISYSTWKGKCIYLEDFLVTESARGMGIGKLLFDAVVREARINRVRRMDWQVLDWNDPAINFYKSQSATLESDWLNGRLFFEV